MYNQIFKFTLNLTCCHFLWKNEHLIFQRPSIGVGEIRKRKQGWWRGCVCVCVCVCVCLCVCVYVCVWGLQVTYMLQNKVSRWAYSIRVAEFPCAASALTSQRPEPRVKSISKLIWMSTGLQPNAVCWKTNIALGSCFHSFHRCRLSLPKEETYKRIVISFSLC